MRRFLSLACFLLLVSLLRPEAADAFELRAERVTAATGTLEGISALHEAGTTRWTVAAERAAWPDLALTAKTLRVALDCVDETDTRCSATWSVAKPRGSGRGGVERAADGSWRLQASSGGHRVELSVPAGEAELRTEMKLPVALFTARMQQAWPQLARVAGDLAARLVISDDAARIAGDWQFTSGEFDSSDGTIAAAALGLGGRLDYTSVAGQERLQLAFATMAGEVLAGALYFELPPAPASLAVDLNGDAQAWRTLSLQLREADGLDAKVEVELDPQQTWRSVRLRDVDANLAAVGARYLAAPLAAAGYAGAQLGGRISGSGELGADGWRNLDLRVQGAGFRDAQDRLNVQGVEGELRMAADAPLSRVRFSTAALFGIEIDGAELAWTWSPRELRLTAPVSFPVLGGRVELQRLLRRDPDGGIAITEAALELQQLDLAALCRALDLPEFGGSIGGSLPALSFQDGVLRSGGDLSLSAFDGSIRVADLVIERLLGVAPSLAADIEMRAIDLKTFTQALSFGEIEGRMNADIRGLRMVDWAPVAFDARFRTDDAYRGRRRLSQRAVQGLSSVGGGSTGTGGLVRLVDSFGYDAIALSCRLEQNVCTMGGLEAAHGGYTIVRGSGLPRINVVGHQQRVDWPMLVRRLQAAATGAAPIID